MMPDIPDTRSKPGCECPVEQPAPQMCVNCIESSGGALSNIQRVMAGPNNGVVVGVKLRSAAEVQGWMESLDTGRCPCLSFT